MIESKRPSFQERFVRAPDPSCWVEKPEYLVRFWLDHPDGSSTPFQCYGVALEKLKSACFIHETRTLSLSFPDGTITVIGPAAFDFYNAFCTNTATFLKSNGVDILTVKFDPKYKREAKDE
jgi:hypothetical protein